MHINEIQAKVGQHKTYNFKDLRVMLGDHVIFVKPQTKKMKEYANSSLLPSLFKYIPSRRDTTGVFSYDGYPLTQESIEQLTSMTGLRIPNKGLIGIAPYLRGLVRALTIEHPGECTLCIIRFSDKRGVHTKAALVCDRLDLEDPWACLVGALYFPEKPNE